MDDQHLRPKTESARTQVYVHGEFKFSLGVDGEITETVKFPAGRPFDAADFDE